MNFVSINHFLSNDKKNLNMIVKSYKLRTQNSNKINLICRPSISQNIRKNNFRVLKNLLSAIYRLK